MLDAGFGGGAFFLADHADALAAKTAEAAQQRFVLAEFAVARERRELGDQRIDEIGQMRPLRMAGDQGFLPRRQVVIEVAERLRGLVLDPRNLFADVAAGGRQCAQFVDLGVEFGDWLFEIKVAAHVIRHQINIKRNALGGEADLGCVKKSSIFNRLSSIPRKTETGCVGRAVASGSRAGTGSFR